MNKDILKEPRESGGYVGRELSRISVWIWALSLPICMTLDELLNGPMPQFLYLKRVVSIVY